MLNISTDIKAVTMSLHHIINSVWNPIQHVRTYIDHYVIQLLVYCATFYTRWVPTRGYHLSPVGASQVGGQDVVSTGPANTASNTPAAQATLIPT